MYSICDICKVCNFQNNFNYFLNKIKKENLDPLKLSVTQTSNIIFDKIIPGFDLSFVYSIPKNTSKKNLPKYHTTIKSKLFVFEPNKTKKENPFETNINEIIMDFNSIKKKYFPTSKDISLTSTNTRSLIEKHLKQGFSKEDFKLVHRYTILNYLTIQKDQNNSFDAKKFFRPITLYNNKFETRLIEAKENYDKIINEFNLNEEYKKTAKELIDIMAQKSETFDIFTKDKFLQNYDNDFNKELIVSWLKQKYTKDQIVNMFDYIIQVYKLHDNLKIRTGEYFKPSTLFNKQFPFRIENAKMFIKEKQTNTSMKDILAKIASNFSSKN